MGDMLQECEECNGTGVDLGNDVEHICGRCEGGGHIEMVMCDVCNGNGCDRCHDEGVRYNVPCPHCETYGKVLMEAPCTFCRGKGTVVHEKFFKDK